MQILTMMMMMMMSFLHPSRADHCLECHNDYFNTFTCVWNSSGLSGAPAVRPDTVCFLHITVEKSEQNKSLQAQMFRDPTQPDIRRAGVVFKNRRGIVQPWAKLHQGVWCENYMNPVARIAVHKPWESVKVSPPQIKEVHNLSVSWTVIVNDLHHFEVQYRSAAQSWTDVKDSIQKTDEKTLELAEDRLLLHHPYVIRVRAKLEVPKAIWSDWSPEYNWTSEVGLTPSTPAIPVVIPGLDWSSSVTGITLTGITLTLLIIVCIFIRSNRSKLLLRNHLSYIPDPSKFFGNLNSHNGENFMTWLGPVLSRESFIKVDTEFVSPVEVLKLQDACDSHSAHRNSGGLQDGWDGAVKSSNFSNSTYFMSQSSKGPSDTLEPCSASSSYGPAGGGSGPETLQQQSADIPRNDEENNGASELELSLKRLEKLRQDTQSPDSGFAGGAEDSIEETDLPSPLALNLLPHLPQDLRAPHPIMHPLLGFKGAPLLGLSCMIPGMDLDLQSACGTIEPASGDYMPVKNVQTEY